MHITFLGHAGFCVETEETLIVMDPWLSPHGAFDASWFQYPCNHALAPLVAEKLISSPKNKYVYVSHEHKDHFDLPFLQSLTERQFSLLLPKYERPALEEVFADYACLQRHFFSDGESLQLGDLRVTLYLDDSGLNRDSAILVESDSVAFFNMNDCKLHDRLHGLFGGKKAIDIFAAQFSGATWHPTCYEYPQKQYEKISKKKLMSKYEATAKAIETVGAKMYLPSAGPPAFLDPTLWRINFEPINIFPRAAQVRAFLEKRLFRSKVEVPDIMPGDVFDANSLEFLYLTPDRVAEDEREAYLEAYADRFRPLFHNRADAVPELQEVLELLQNELESKLAHFPAADMVQRPLYFGALEQNGPWVCVNFAQREVSIEQEKQEAHYCIEAPSWEIMRVLNRLLTWEDFSLTFRMKVNREPDVYQTLIQGFLILEAADLVPFCEKLMAIEQANERCVVEAGGIRYAVNRFCPHQGADLTEAWIEEDRFLVCPRHRWRFDLQGGGQCESSDETVSAIALEED